MLFRSATRVMTVSESSKRDILRYVNISPDKIDVIYNSYDERFAAPPDDAAMHRLRERYQLHDPKAAGAGNTEGSG